MAPKKCIEKMVDQYELMFGEKPSQRPKSPLEKNDHPELDDSPLLDEDGIRKCQSLIGTLQWAMSLTRFDIATAVMTMSGFRVAPRQGHLERVLRICGCLLKFRQGCLRIRTEEPDFSGLPNHEHDWARTVYGGAEETLPTNTPPPKGKRVVSFQPTRMRTCVMI